MTIVATSGKVNFEVYWYQRHILELMHVQCRMQIN